MPRPLAPYEEENASTNRKMMMQSLLNAEKEDEVEAYFTEKYATTHSARWVIRGGVTLLGEGLICVGRMVWALCVWSACMWLGVGPKIILKLCPLDEFFWCNYMYSRWPLPFILRVINCSAHYCFIVCCSMDDLEEQPRVIMQQRHLPGVKYVDWIVSCRLSWCFYCRDPNLWTVKCRVGCCYVRCYVRCYVCQIVS